MSNWLHHNPVRIHFGRGCRAALAEVLSYQRVLIVCTPRGRQQLESDDLLSLAIRRSKRLVWIDSVEANPDLDRLQEVLNNLKGENLDCVLGLGGGSAIDSSKVLALALSAAADQRSLRDLLDVAAELPFGVSLPLYAIPTTAGTGSEVTPFATVWDHHKRRKFSLSGPAVYPREAFVDPELTDSLPNSPTLYTGLDAINQAAESIWNRNMTPMSEMLAHRALELGITALPRLLKDLANKNCRDIMAEVSLLAGIAISQTKTSVCHSISYPMTAHFGIPHGLACAFTMKAVLRHNLEADDGRFQRLSNKLLKEESKYQNSKGLIDIFDSISQELKVSQQVRDKVKSLEALISLSNEMYTVGRADNALANIDDSTIKEILLESWNSK